VDLLIWFASSWNELLIKMEGYVTILEIHRSMRRVRLEVDIQVEHHQIRQLNRWFVSSRYYDLIFGIKGNYLQLLCWHW
jgi:hypothetical protein